MIKNFINMEKVIEKSLYFSIFLIFLDSYQFFDIPFTWIGSGVLVMICFVIFFKENDPACDYYSTPILFYKGYQGLATYRAANCLWKNNRHTMALFFQNRASEIFGVDIHPAAEIKGGVMIDHATGVVIGETTTIDENVSIYQGVTLGGKGFEIGDRHPKIKSGVSIFASSTVLGNITIGKNAKVAAGSLVLKDVEAETTVAGIPAKKL